MNYTILIADDEPEIRTLLRLYLENENYQIIEAENGKQALELLKKEHVDLCLSAGYYDAGDGRIPCVAGIT